MKLMVLGGIFVIAGAGCSAFPWGWPFYIVLGLIFTSIGLLLAVIGALKKDKPDQ